MKSLSVSGLVGGYGKMRVLNEIDLEAKEGEIVCIMGPNGAGKSTLLKTIVGLLKPWKGQVRYGDDDITGLEPRKIAREGLALVLQGQRLFRQMTVLENLEMGAHLVADREIVKQRLAEVEKQFPILKQRERQIAGSLSGGEQEILSVARALMLDPKFILMDEPSVGLAPIIIRALDEILQTLKSTGRGILIVEQRKWALGSSDHAYLITGGKIVFNGNPSDVTDEVIHNAYLHSGDSKRSR